MEPDVAGESLKPTMPIAKTFANTLPGLVYKLDQSWDGQPVHHEPYTLHLDWIPQRRPDKTHKKAAVSVRLEGPLMDEPEPPPGLGGFCPSLGDHEAFALFFCNAREQYLEVLVGPHGHWLCRLHNGVRRPFNQGEDMLLEIQNKLKGDSWQSSFEIPLAYFPPNVTKFNAYKIHGHTDSRRYETAFPLTDGSVTKRDLHGLAFFGKLDPAKLFPAGFNDGVVGHFWGKALSSIELLPVEMLAKVLEWLDFRAVVALGSTCRRLRRHAFRGFRIGLPPALERPVAIYEWFPSFVEALQAAVAAGAHFHNVMFRRLIEAEGLMPEDIGELLGLVLAAETRTPRLEFLELELDAVGDQNPHTMAAFSKCSALRGLRLFGKRETANFAEALALLADLPALHILDMALDGEPCTLEQLNRIPVERLTDFRMTAHSPGQTQTWLKSLPCLPNLRSLHVVCSDEVVMDPFTLQYFENPPLVMEWNKVPALRWLEGNFDPAGLGQLQFLERWREISPDGVNAGAPEALAAVLANPGRPVGLKLYAADDREREEEHFTGMLGSKRGFVWWVYDDSLPEEFHRLPTGWDYSL